MYNKGEMLYDTVEESYVVVARVASQPASEVCFDTRYGERTVAEHNRYLGVEDCGDDPVVVSVYANQLQKLMHKRGNDRSLRDITTDGRGTLARRAIRNGETTDYHFPVSRLQRDD